MMSVSAANLNDSKLLLPLLLNALLENIPVYSETPLNKPVEALTYIV